MALDQSTFDALLFENLKATTGAMNAEIIRSTQNATSAQQNMNSLAQVLAGRVADTVLNTDIASQIAELNAAVASMIGSLKGGGNVPPVTP